MTWPTVAVNTTNCDSTGDSPALFRADIFDAITKLNQMIGAAPLFPLSSPTFAQVTATGAIPLPASGVDTFAFQAQGSYGGGYALVDGTYNIGMWCTSGTLNIGFGTSLGALTAKATIDNNGSAVFSGNLTAGLSNIASNGYPLTVSSLNSANIKLVMKDAGVTRGHIGADAGSCFAVINAANTLYTLTVDNSGNVSIPGNYNGNGSGLSGTAASLNAGVGVGQSMVNRTGTVGLATTYNNSTGKTITVFVCAQGNNAGSPGTITGYVDGVVVGTEWTSDGVGTWNAAPATLCFPVTSGKDYIVYSGGGGSSIVSWSELR